MCAEKIYTLNVPTIVAVSFIDGDMDHETMGTAVEQCHTQKTRKTCENLIDQKLAGFTMIILGLVGAALDPQEGGAVAILLGGLGAYMICTKKRVFF